MSTHIQPLPINSQTQDNGLRAKINALSVELNEILDRQNAHVDRCACGHTWPCSDAHKEFQPVPQPDVDGHPVAPQFKMVEAEYKPIVNVRSCIECAFEGF